VPKRRPLETCRYKRRRAGAGQLPITVALANVTGSPRAKSRPPDGARYMRERLKAQEEAAE